MKTTHKLLAVLSLAFLLSGCTPVSSSQETSSSAPSSTTSETVSSEEVSNASSIEEVTSSEASSEEVTSSEVSSEQVSSEEETNGKLHLSFEGETAGDIAGAKEIGQFKLHATEEKTLSIADTETTINETKYTKGIKTNGSSSTTSGKEYRVIEFTTTGAGTVKIAAKSGSADDATRTITILNKGKGVAEDTKTVPVDATVLEFTLHSAGTFLISASGGLWYYDIEVNFVEGTGDINWEPPIAVADNNILLPSEIGNRTLERETTVGNFTILAGEGDDKKIEIDVNSKTCNDIKFTHRLKFGGTGSRDNRCIKFSVTAPTIVSIYAMSSTSKEDKPANLVKLGATAAEDAVVEEVTCLSSKLSCFTFEVEAGNYGFWATNGGVNVYGIYLEA